MKKLKYREKMAKIQFLDKEEILEDVQRENDRTPLVNTVVNNNWLDDSSSMNAGGTSNLLQDITPIYSILGMNKGNRSNQNSVKRIVLKNQELYQKSDISKTNYNTRHASNHISMVIEEEQKNLKTNQSQESLEIEILNQLQRLNNNESPEFLNRLEESPVKQEEDDPFFQEEVKDMRSYSYINSSITQDKIYVDYVAIKEQIVSKKFKTEEVIMQFLLREVEPSILLDNA